MRKGLYRLDMMTRLFFPAFLLFSQLIAEVPLWQKDYQRAFEESARAKKPLLLFFNGSDCSGWGMKLKHEILSSPEFVALATGRFVCVEIDFPEHKAVDEHLASERAALKERWKVQEIPRLILIDAEGKEIARFGSTSLSAKEFGEDLLSIIEKDQKLNTALKNLGMQTPGALEDLYKLARELERENEALSILNIGVMKGALFFLLEKYRLLVEEGKSSEAEALHLRQRLVALDPKNEKKIPFSLALIDFQRLSNEKLINPFVAIRPLEEYLSKWGLSDHENKWRLEMMIAQFYVDCDEWKTALKHAESALESAPDSRKEEIARSLEYIRGESVIADSE